MTETIDVGMPGVQFASIVISPRPAQVSTLPPVTVEQPTQRLLAARAGPTQVKSSVLGGALHAPRPPRLRRSALRIRGSRWWRSPAPRASPKTITR